MSQSKARAARKTSLRDQLARKRAKVVTEYFPLGEQGEKALERLEEAQQTLARARRVASLQADKATIDVAALEAALAEAEAERDRHCLAVRIRGLSEDERDALQSEFMVEDVDKDADADKRKKVEARNAQRIREWTYHALAAAVQDSDLTADDWRDELTSDRWTAGDLERLRVAIIRAYGAQPAENIPKG